MRHGCSSPSFCCSPRSLFVATCVCPRPCCRKQDNDRRFGQTMHECARPCMHSHSFGVTRRCMRTRISCAVKCDRCVASRARTIRTRHCVVRIRVARCGVRDAHVSRGDRPKDAHVERRGGRRTCVRCVIGASRRRDRPARRSRRSWDRARASRRAPRCGRLHEALAALRSLS